MVIERTTNPEPQSYCWDTQATSILILMAGGRMAAVFSAYFDQEGYRVAAAKDRKEARRVSTHIQPDIIITDEEIDQSGSYAFLYENNPAIFILLPKPAPYRSQVQPGIEPVKRSVRPRALGRRIRAALHRAGKRAPEARIYQSGRVVLDRERHSIQIADRYVTLTPTEFDILSVVIASPGRVFSRAELRERVLGAESRASDRTIDVHVMNIRAKLGNNQQAHPFIETVHRVGYRFAPD